MEIYLKIPEICPYCGTKLIIEENNNTKNLICPNNNCDMRLINKLDHFCGKKGMDIKGLSKATLEKLIDWEWISSIQDIYSLYEHRSQWIKKTGFGIKSVDNILNAIEGSRKCELHSFITAIGIPLIGSTYAKTLAKEEETWVEFRDDIDEGVNFALLEGFGPEMNASIYKFNFDEADRISNKLNIVNNYMHEVSASSNGLKGLNIVITGKLSKPRAEIKDLITRCGGRVTDSVSSKTAYLVANAPESTTKYNKAVSLNIPIIMEQELIKMCEE